MLLMTLQAAAISWGVAHAHDGVTMAQAEEVRHGMLAPSSEGPGHSHDDGEPDESVPGHFHGHNAFDHSHEAPGVISGFSVVSPVAFPQWKAGLGFPTRAGPPYQIDRPPISI